VTRYNIHSSHTNAAEIKKASNYVLDPAAGHKHAMRLIIPRAPSNELTLIAYVAFFEPAPQSCSRDTSAQADDQRLARSATITNRSRIFPASYGMLAGA